MDDRIDRCDFPNSMDIEMHFLPSLQLGIMSFCISRRSKGELLKHNILVGKVRYLHSSGG